MLEAFVHFILIDGGCTMETITHWLALVNLILEIRFLCTKPELTFC